MYPYIVLSKLNVVFILAMAGHFINNIFAQWNNDNQLIFNVQFIELCSQLHLVITQ